jgi:hypothetical protein
MRPTSSLGERRRGNAPLGGSRESHVALSTMSPSRHASESIRTGGTTLEDAVRMSVDHLERHRRQTHRGTEQRAFPARPAEESS